MICLSRHKTTKANVYICRAMEAKRANNVGDNSGDNMVTGMVAAATTATTAAVNREGT